MALTSLGGVRYFPIWPDGLYSLNTSIGSNTLNHADDRIACIIRMPVSGDISEVHFLTGFVSGAQTLQVSLQNLSAGVPDLTVDQYRDVSVADTDDSTLFATGIITDDGTDGGVKRTVAAGDIIAVVFRLPSYSSGSLAIAGLSGGSGDGRLSRTLFSNSGGTFSALNYNPMIAIEMADGSFPTITRSALFASAATQFVTTASTPDEYALKLTIPVPMRAIGVYIKGGSAGVEALLYDNAGSTLAGPVTNWEETTSQSIVKDYYFSSPVELVAGIYRIAWRPSDLTSRFMNVQTLGAAAHRGAWDLGANFELSTRSDAGSWTDDNTKFIVAGLIVDQLDDGAGGGGGGGCTLINGTAVIPPTCT